MLTNEQLTTLMAVARKVFNSGVAPKECTNEDAVFAIMLAGTELGIEPMQSLRCIQIVKGKLSYTADFTVALVQRDSRCKFFRLVEGTDKAATYETLREGHAEPTRLTYTIAQAQRAGLTKNSTWTSHPEAMLRARCGAALARLVYPDLAAGVYLPDEAEEAAANDNAPRSAAQLPAPPTENAALAAYRARVGACVVSDELVAVRLALGPTLSTLSPEDLAEAGKVTRAHARDLFGNVEDYEGAVTAAKEISKDPAHWSVVAAATAAMVRADDAAALKDATAAHTKALAALPQPLKDRMATLLRARRAALAPKPATDAAAAIEEALRAADGIPALDDIYDRIAAAVTEGKVTRDQAAALAKLYNDRVAEMEREPATEDAA